MYKEGKIAKADGSSASKTFVVVLDHDILIHAEMWKILNSGGDFKDNRTMNTCSFYNIIEWQGALEGSWG